jgi:hypothetical protein
MTGKEGQDATEKEKKIYPQERKTDAAGRILMLLETR